MVQIFGSPLPFNVFIMAFVLLAIQVLILSLGATVRYTRDHSIGLYNRKVKWPWSYSIKIGLQCLMILILLA